MDQGIKDFLKACVVEEDASEIFERVVRTKVVRDGKRKIKMVTDKAGYKVVDGKEVRMDAVEKRNRKKAAKVSSKKRKSKMTSINLKRDRSMQKRVD